MGAVAHGECQVCGSRAPVDMASRIAELEAALRPFAIYAAKRDEMPMRGLGDSVHRIHGGTEHETEITMQHCREARRVLANR